MKFQNIISLLLIIALICSCANHKTSEYDVKEGDRYVTEVTYIFDLNGNEVSRSTNIINVSIDFMSDHNVVACYPDEVELYKSLLEGQWHLMSAINQSIKDGDFIDFVRIFNDIERPSCFKGFQSDRYVERVSIPNDMKFVPQNKITIDLY